MTREEFIEAVVRLQSEAGRLKLYRTLHAFQEVKEAYGRDCDSTYAKAKESSHG